MRSLLRPRGLHILRATRPTCACRLLHSSQPARSPPPEPPPPPPLATGGAAGFTDIVADGGWVQRLLPAAAFPYAALGRWDRPIGTWLLLWPCLWSTALAAPAGAPPDLALCALFGVGAFAMRGAGCTVNDLWDRDIDRQVERTRGRPLASGALGVPQALGFLAAQLGVGLGMLLALPPYCVGLGFASVPLFVLYPLAKRVTDWPQAMLGLTFNWGALMGWGAVHGSLHLPAVLPLYCGGIAWTLMYDTIYAHQDKADDARIGVRSTALRLGDGDGAVRMLALFAALTVGGLALAGAAVELPPAYYGGLAAGGAHLGWQLRTVDLSCRADCLRKFQSNGRFGAIVFAAIVGGRLLQEAQEAAARGDGEAAARGGERRRPASTYELLWQS